jgi:hypothetical protein
VRDAGRARGRAPWLRQRVIDDATTAERNHTGSDLRDQLLVAQGGDDRAPRRRQRMQALDTFLLPDIAWRHRGSRIDGLAGAKRGSQARRTRW